MPPGDEVPCRRAVAEHLPRDAVGRVAGAVRLDVAAPGARAVARLALLDDHDVPELRPAAEEPAADHDAAADAGAEGQHHHVVEVAARAEGELAERRDVRVVVDADRDLEAPLHLVAESHLADRDVDRAEDDAGAMVDARRHAEADGLDVRREDLAHRCLERVEERRLRRRRRRMLDSRADTSVGLDDTREDLRAAEVDADDAVARH